MNILAIETSCDETAVAVVCDGKTVLSSLVSSQADTHSVFGGVVPEIASRLHCEYISSLTANALTDAGVTIDDIDAVAVTYAPGLVGALLVGINFAKGVSMAINKPIIPVHHIKSHIAANYILHDELEPPFLSLVVSGGHSHIIEVLGYTQFRVIGRTRDDAAGEAFDKAARAMGLGYPGGIEIEKAAKGGDSSAYKFTKPRLANGEYDYSFSGLKTALINTIHNARQKGESINTSDLAASFQEVLCDILTEKFILAANRFGYKKIALAGGVSANSRLREILEERCQPDGIKLYLPPLWLCGDNAAMVGVQGYYEYLAGNTGDMSLNAYPSLAV